MNGPRNVAQEVRVLDPTIPLNRLRLPDLQQSPTGAHTVIGARVANASVEARGGAIAPCLPGLHRRAGDVRGTGEVPGLFKFMSATPGGGGYFCRLPACQKQQIFCKSCHIFLKIHLKTK